MGMLLTPGRAPWGKLNVVYREQITKRRIHMASSNIDDLIPEFRPKAKTLLANCRNRGIEMRAYETLRSPFEQGKIWRQSRTKGKVQAKIQELRDAGAEFLAFCIESVGPQSGPHETDAPPGLSWHQWGEAFDSFWLVNGDAEWSSTRKINGLNGYHVYAEEAAKLDLTPGGLWPTFKDWPHAQFRSASSPTAVLSLTDIDQIMKERFGG
jgi:peptidoglycan L-alanyl-D-glutamate endopeptidase CwlK